MLSVIRLVDREPPRGSLSQWAVTCGTSTASAIELTIPDVSGVPGPNIAAIPSDNNSQTRKGRKFMHMVLKLFKKELSFIFPWNIVMDKLGAAERWDKSSSYETLGILAKHLQCPLCLCHYLIILVTNSFSFEAICCWHVMNRRN